MILGDQKYQPLQDEDEEYGLQIAATESRRRQSGWRNWVLASLFALSVLLNCGFLFRGSGLGTDKTSHCQSKWAHIEDNKRTTLWNDATPYVSEDLAVSDKAWEALSPDGGVIALDKEWAASQGLTESTLLFPWDPSKAMYLLNSHHGFHCLNKLHRSLKQYREGLPQSNTFEHMLHCLDWLRKDIMCTADDTPLATTNSFSSEINLGAQRQCRDWDRLLGWAQEHNACYRYGNNTEEMAKSDQFDRFSHCPPGSPYLPAVRKHYGKPDDWMPQDATDLG